MFIYLYIKSKQHKLNNMEKNDINIIVSDLFVNDYDQINSSRKKFNSILNENKMREYSYNEYCILFNKSISTLIENVENVTSNDLITEMITNVIKQNR